MTQEFQNTNVDNYETSRGNFQASPDLTDEKNQYNCNRHSEKGDFLNDVHFEFVLKILLWTLQIDKYPIGTDN